VLYLIDGNSLVYRAFFALPESIATSTGEPTNAIFGFASMLVKLITEYGVDADRRRLGRRQLGPHRALPQYKAQRARAPTCCASSGRRSSRSSRRSATATRGWRATRPTT
jgi:DNA polymerase-1